MMLYKLINFDSDHDNPMIIVSDKTIKNAIQLTEFYLSQVVFLNKVLCLDGSLDGSLAPNFSASE